MITDVEERFPAFESWSDLMLWSLSGGCSYEEINRLEVQCMARRRSYWE